MKDSSPTPPASGWNAAIEAAAQCAEIEPVPTGPMPDEMREHVIEDIVRGTVLATRKAIAKRIRSLTRPDSPSGWQTIDSAPKDGTDIMVGDYQHVDVGFWSEEAGAWFTELSDFAPTHWRPLPEPPSPREGE